jgi:hypothetical protein
VAWPSCPVSCLPSRSFQRSGPTVAANAWRRGPPRCSPTSSAGCCTRSRS